MIERKYILSLGVVVLTVCGLFDLKAQVLDSTLVESIAVSARLGNDSITLRWAPISLSIWLRGNSTGYVVERYVMSRNGNVLPVPEKAILTPTPIRPLDLARWEPLVKRDRFGAIAAQALFGDRFEVNLANANIFTIVNKVQENEQRYAFALFSADMSPAVARASGLWFTDRDIKKYEKYLYRIVIPEGGSEKTVRGSIFVSPDEPYDLPKSENLKAEVKDHIVSLRWDKPRTNLYTAYRLERSTDGKVFLPTSEVPLVTVSPNENADAHYEYASDSLPDLTGTFYYRVRGITPFGDEGAPSDVVNVKGRVNIADVPFIREGGSADNKSIQIEWEFPEKYNAVIKGFSVERSSKPQAAFMSLTLQSPLPATTRTYSDRSPVSVNYYRVVAHGLDGEQYRSPIYLAQLVDSLPPIAPVNLRAVVDELGKISLQWQANTEPDIFGYRIYRSNHEAEEMSQITSEPVTLNSFQDQVNLNTLNEAIYYKVMAIDRNQNHSDLSPMLKVNLPDKVKPMPPVFLPVTSNEEGIALSWIQSSSKDVVQYDLYRKLPGRAEWHRIKILASSPDSTFRFLDDTAEPGATNTYTITAVDEAGLESEPATPVTGVRIDNQLRSPVQWKEPVYRLEKKTVVLAWNYDMPNVTLFRLYRSDGLNPAILYKTITADKREFVDALGVDHEYRYQIMAVFANGSKSSFSKELLVKF